MENQKTPEEYTGVKGLVRSIYQETATSFVDSNNNYVTVFPDKIEYIKTQDICTGGAKTSTGSVSATGSGNINPSAISSGRIVSYLTVGDLVAIDGTRGLISLGIPSSGVVGDNSYMYMNASGIFGYHGTDTFPWFFAATKDMVFGSRTYHGGDFFIGEIDSAYLWWQYDEHKLIIAGDISISGDIESSNFEYDPFTGTLVGYKLEYYGGNAYFGGAIVSGNSFITGNTSIYGNNVTIAGQSIVNVGNVSDSTALTIPAGLLVDGTAITIANDGTISANITLSWTAETDPRFDHYQIRYKKSSFTYYQYISSNSNTITIDGLTPNTSYDFAVSSVNKYGIPSTYSSTVTYTTATSTTAPAKVSGVSAVGGIQYVIVEWTSNSEKDLSSYNVYRNTVNNSGTAILISNIRGNYLVDGNLVGGTQYFYWVKAVNTSGLVSTNFSTVASATPRNVAGSDTVISQRGWTQTCIFSSTSATQVNWGAGRFIASDGTTYNILAGNTGVMTARTYIFLDIDVSTTQYQITTVAGNAVGNNRVLIGSAINGTIEATFTIFSGDGAIKISKEGLEDGSIDLSKFGSGLTPVEVLDILPTENNFDGRMVFLTTDKKLYRYNAIDEEFTTAVPTTDLTGTIVKEQIADGSIDLSKFSNGLTPIEVLDTLPVDNNFDGRIVFLTTDKKLYRYNATEGEFTAAVPTTDLTGTITGEQIAGGSIDLSKFGSGLTPVEVLDTLPTENNFDGRIVFLTIDKKLYRYNGTQEEFTAAVPTTDLTGTIVETQIADNSISTGKIKANAITANEIAAGTITGNKIAANTIEAGNIATGTITANEIAAQTIETGNIKAGAITANEIAAGTITGNKIAAGTIEAGNIAAETITGNEIAAQTIAAAHIITGTITATQIATNTITANQIAANTITAGQIAAGTITANEIATNTITANEIAANTITAGQIAAGTITGNEIAANTIEAGNIKAGTITTVELNFIPVKDTNVIASINASEEGIDISASKIATISAEKILIDGTTYLSNWRKSGDLTKIDGGSISTGSVTTAQLNFTPVIDGTIIASINASEEGIQISGEHIAISGSTTFSSGYDPITKVNKLGGSYASASSGARVLIFPDTNTGLQIIDDGGADVFKAIIGGTNVGDVIIGNYTGGQGIFYDKSEAKTIFKGSMIAGNITGVAITGGTISIGNLNNIFKADSNGIYLGNSTFASAPFRVDMAGNLTATSATITGAITTGAGSSINGTYIDSIAANKITAGTGIVNNLSILSTLTMGSSGTNGIIQSYGWNGTSAGFKMNGGATPSFELIGGTITGGTIQTSASGDRIIMNGSTNKIEFKNGNILYSSMYPYGGGSGSGFVIATHGSYVGTASLILFEGISTSGVLLTAISINLNGTTYLNGATVNGGNITPSTNNSYSLGTNSYRFNNVHTNAITLNGIEKTSWPTSFSGNLSDLSINTTKSWGSYGITGLGTITPYSNNTYSLGSSSYKWNNIYSTYVTFDYLGKNLDANSYQITNVGTITPYSNNTYSLGSSSYKWNNVYSTFCTFDYLGKNLNANSYQITNVGTITPYSNNSYDLGSTSYYWRNIYGINIIPHGSTASYLGNSSYYWDYLYVDTIRGASGTSSIGIENNAYTKYLFPDSTAVYDLGSSSYFYRNTFTQSLRLRTGLTTNPSNSGEIRYYDGTGGGFRGMVGSWLGQFDMTAK